MRGTIAKRLRKEVYKDMATRRAKYTYLSHQVYKTRVKKDGTKEGYFIPQATRVCAGLRAEYLWKKKEYKWNQNKQKI